MANGDRNIFKKIVPQKMDPRVALVLQCPSGCDPPLILHALPKLEGNLPSMARCFRCGTYWEVTREGLIINKKQWLESGQVPKVPEVKTP